MKAFKFSLQALLTLREQQEQAALQAYTKALQTQERAFSLRESARLELEEAQAHFQTRRTAGAGAGELSQLRAWCESIQHRLQQWEHKAALTRHEAKRHFTKLLAARHATSVLLKLQQNQRRQHRRHQRQLEQTIMDNLEGRRGIQNLLFLSPQRSLWN